MRIRLGVVGLMIILIGILWLTTPTSPWSEGFEAQATVQARYIHFQHSQQGCLNLAEVRAYEYKGGPNVVPTDAVVTQSSPGNPSKHLVDRNIDTIAHTSCGDVPWLRIDLGKMVPLHIIHVVNRRDCCRNRAIGLVLSLLDEQQKPVYVSEPMKDKSGKTTYIDTPEHYMNLTSDYPATMTWYPPNAKPVYDEKDVSDTPTNMKCRTISTPFNDEGGGNAVYLDRHNVECEPNETLNRFHLVRESGPKGATGKYRYDYSCCQSNVPQPSPTKMATLEADIQGIQRQLSKSAPLSSEKMATLETDIQRIQSQLSKSAPPPSREDIIPENRLTETGAAATALGKQSSLLRDIQGVIRNELYSERATDPLL